MTTEYLYQQEVDRVLSALMPQNQLIVRVMLHTGMRLSDVLAMRTDNLAMTGWYTEIKTGKKRRYGLPKPLYEAIKAQAGPEWAFPGRKIHEPKTRQAVWKDIKRAAKAFRLPQNVGAHSMRKVYAVRLMKRYGDIERVRKNLNHTSSSVTVIYAMADTLMERKKRQERKKKEQDQKWDVNFNPPSGGAGGGAGGEAEAGRQARPESRRRTR